MKAYQLKIMLKNSKPPIWRRCIIPSGITFSQLSLILNEVMGWSGMHLSTFEFYHIKLYLLEDDGWGYFEAPWDYDLADASQTFVDEFMENEAWFTYTYDLGDDWSHRVTIEKVVDNYDKNFPQVIKYKGDCPPEDIGGIEMYHAILDGTYEDITGCPVDPIYIEEYDIDEVNDYMESMLFIHWEKKGESRLAHEIIESDVFSGKGLIGCKNPINDFKNSDSITERKSNQYENYDDILVDLDEFMKRIEELKKENAIIGQTHRNDQWGDFAPRRKLDVSLTSFTKEDLMDLGMKHGLDIKKSWKKDKMLQMVCEAILNKETFKRNFSLLNEEEIKAFEKVADSLYEYIIDEDECFLYDRLYNWGYVLITVDNEVIVPLDIEELYREINTKEFKKDKKYISWIDKCIFFLQCYYGCAPFDIMLQLANMNKNIHISNIRLKDYLSQFKDKVVFNDEYVMVKELSQEYENFILWQGKDKDYYIPTIDEIEYLYENGFYKPSKYDFAMINFIEKICKNHDEAVMTEQIIQRMIYNDESLQDIIDLLEKNGIYFDNGISEFIMLFNNLWNNTRLIKNKGYTPNETVRSMGVNKNMRPTIVPVSSKAASLLEESKKDLEQRGIKIDLESTADTMQVSNISKDGNVTFVREVKVYPNDSCPCGSGRKYKKCCGKNR